MKQMIPFIFISLGILSIATGIILLNKRSVNFIAYSTHTIANPPMAATINAGTTRVERSDIMGELPNMARNEVKSNSVTVVAQAATAVNTAIADRPATAVDTINVPNNAT